MVVEHLPSPKESQAYQKPYMGRRYRKVPGQTMIKTIPNGPLAVMVTNVTVDKHAGEVATGRVYGGAISKGTRNILSWRTCKKLEYNK